MTDIAKMIDHSLLRPELTLDDVKAGCELAARYQVASVCVKPSDVAFACNELNNTGVDVCTVISFPHGSSTSATKAAEARTALRDGATELDMVLNIGRLHAGDDEPVAADIRAVVEAAGDAVVKVILENAYLTDDEKIRGCIISERCGARFVKTSTGFAPGGATLDDVRLMRQHVSDAVGIKAAGGVRTLDVLLEFVEAGASRFGATATATILDDAKARGLR